MIRNALTGGLSPRRFSPAAPPKVLPPRVVADAESFDACDRPISLDEVARRVSEHEAVFIGETHGHPLGLAVRGVVIQIWRVSVPPHTSSRSASSSRATMCGAVSPTR